MTSAANIFTLDNGLFGLRLDDGVEIVGGGDGMTLTEARNWADRIENEQRIQRCPAVGCGRETGIVEPPPSLEQSGVVRLI